MRKYLFELHCIGDTNYHHEMFECDVDAMMRGREILKEGKRDNVAFMISVYGKNAAGDWKHIVSYQ